MMSDIPRSLSLSLSFLVIFLAGPWFVVLWVVTWFVLYNAVRVSEAVPATADIMDDYDGDVQVVPNTFRQVISENINLPYPFSILFLQDRML